ncbi:hypothetical protein PPACK8108_LOCUS22155 [Phakopsora pachyrhizi]|uniref:Proteasome activator subunit 4 n=1 Tax=Phakopsora pachyrhizi TaxID=170000 RepID=A0AAV0BML9_PHAPC|nr:hypothetical protein PPACK8108_LOCUS22155 [Phakopsora pachyrhizi]
MPYQLESLSEMDDYLEMIVRRILEAAQARDFDFAFTYWNAMLEVWLELRYPMKRRMRARLIEFYYNICVSPGMDPTLVEIMIEMMLTLIKSQKLVDLRSVQLDWVPLYEVLLTEIDHKERAVGVTNIYTMMLSLAGSANRFFPPHTALKMFERFLPRLSGTHLESALVTQSLLCHFLPISHPTSWLPSIFRLWTTFQSQYWSEQWLELLSRLSQKHVDPNASDPRIYYIFENLERGESFESKAFEAVSDFADEPAWLGIRRDVGIFTEKQWSFIMTHCVQVFGVPVGTPNTQVTAAHGAKNADSRVSSQATATLKPADVLESLAVILVYSMSEDGDSNSPECRALSAASKLLTAMETFFHPSNHGRWSAKLTKFLRHLAWRFAVRWSEEAKADCPTPEEWRLTARIRTQFVTMLSSPILISLFSKDFIASSYTQQALRIAAYLDPSIMIPPIIEQSVLALEGLLETHRTTTCIAALTAVTPTMLKKQSYPAGAANLPTILDLLLPGIDPNDPSKTMYSSMLISKILSRIKLSDVTLDSSTQVMVELEPSIPTLDTTWGSSIVENGTAVVESTSFLLDWTLTYFKRVMSFFENLPEPQGKQEKTGGKVEENTISCLCASFEELCKAVSPEFFLPMIEYFKTYICDNFRFNMVKTVGLIASSLSKGFADPITFRTIYPLCDSKIRAELEAGAASIPSMSTGAPLGSDLKLHWLFSVLVGVSAKCGDVLLEFRSEILSLLHYTLKECKSKRSQIFISKFLFTILRALIEIYPKDTRFLNPDEWDVPETKSSHQNLWGKTYKVTDIKISWHVPSTEEIDFALQIIGEIIEPMLREMNSLLDEVTLDHDRKCNFVKLCTMAKAALCGISTLVVIGPPSEPGDPVTDWGEHILELSKQLPSVNAGIVLTPPDKRYEQIIKLRKDLSEVVHRSVTHLSLFDDNIECVKAIIGIISSLLIDPAFEASTYENHRQSYRLGKSMNQNSGLQKEYPRVVWIRYAQLLHLTRLRSPRRPHQRSALDDKIIKDLLEFSLSPWVSIRRLTQKTLCTVAQVYDGGHGLLLPTLLDSLKPGIDPDRMKGAIYVLGSKSFSSFCLQDWRYARQYLLAFLQCQHAPKTSIQSLVSSLLHRHSFSIREIENMQNTVKADGFDEAVEQLNVELIHHKVENSVSKFLDTRRLARLEMQNAQYHQLVSELLNISGAPTTNWKYSLNANRLLNEVVRRDQPLNASVASHFLKELHNSELPSKRVQALSSISRLLHFVKLRTMCSSDQDLLLRKSKNPLKFMVKFPSPLQKEEFELFISKLRQPLSDGPEFLIDEFLTGWLICDEEKAYRLSDEESLTAWDPSSESALKVFRDFLIQDTFWKKLLDYFSQEQNRNHLAANNVTALKSIFQIFRDEFWQVLLPKLEELLSDPANRHKQRAAAEIIAGVIRATKHWPLARQAVVWEWFQARLKEIYDAMRPEGLPCWLMCIEYILQERDPRRNQPLIDFILALETDGYSSTFAASKAHQFVGTVIKALSWTIAEPYLKRLSDVYWGAIDNDYLEVRTCISLNLRSLAEHQTHLSFPDAKSFLRACQNNGEEDKPLIADCTIIRSGVEPLLHKLQQTRQIRLPAQHGNQEYDKCAMTVLMWIWSSLTDFQAAAIHPFLPGIIRELFYMHEMIDNQELSRLSNAVMLSLAWMPWPGGMVDSILVALLRLSQASSWKIRLDVLKILRVFFFHQLFMLSRPQVEEILEFLCIHLEDTNAEVREAAAVTLSGIVHCSERTSILKLKNRFTKTLQETPVPRHRFVEGVEQPTYLATLVKIHAAVLGSSSLVNAFPYDVPSWVPEVLIKNICSHMSSPATISTTARNTLTVFKKTHQDTWVEGQKMFSEEDLATLNDCLVGSSYYA